MKGHGPKTHGPKGRGPEGRGPKLKRVRKALQEYSRTLAVSARADLLRAAALRFLQARGLPPGEFPRSLAPRLLGGSASLAGASRAVRRHLDALDACVPAAFLARPHALGWIYLFTQVSEPDQRRWGIHYTPAEVVDVVAGHLLAEEACGPETLAGTRVLDPACGCGAFLIGAYEHLFARYRRRTRLGAAEIARRLLADHLYGVDVDGLAVEVSRLTLAARAAADGCRPAPAPHIVEADALAGPPGSIPSAMVPSATVQSATVQSATVSHVIGNPPFVEGRWLEAETVAALKARYRAAAGKVNTACCFIERSLELLAPGGRLGLVVPATILRNGRYRAARAVLLEHRLERVLTIRRVPFEGAVFDAALIFARRTMQALPRGVQAQPWVRDPRVRDLGSATPCQRRLDAGTVQVACVEDIAAARRARTRAIPQAALARTPEKIIHVHVSAGELRLLAKIERAGEARAGGFALGERYCVRDGVSTGFAPFPERLLGTIEGGTFVARCGERERFDPARHRPVIDGGEFTAWSPIGWQGRYIRYDKRLEQHPPPPRGRPFNCQLRDRAIFERPAKVLTRQTAGQLIATLDTDRYVTRNSIHNTYPADRYEDAVSLPALVALLNSRLMNAYYVATSGENGRAFPQVHIARLRLLPVAAGLVEPGGALERLARRRLAARARAAKLDEAMDGLICRAYGLSEVERRHTAALWRRSQPAARRTRPTRKGHGPKGHGLKPRRATA